MWIVRQFLRVAIQRGDAKTVSLILFIMLEFGANVDIQDKRGQTALIIARPGPNIP